MMLISNHDSDNDSGITYTMGDDTNGTEHLNALVSLVTVERDIDDADNDNDNE